MAVTVQCTGPHAIYGGGGGTATGDDGVGAAGLPACANGAPAWPQVEAASAAGDGDGGDSLRPHGAPYEPAPPLHGAALRGCCVSLFPGANITVHSAPLIDLCIDRWLAAPASTQALLLRDTVRMERDLDAMQLCTDAERIVCEPNAGGMSVNSEALSMEYLARRLLARNVVTEMEVRYWCSNWKKCDFLCSVQGRRVGVSVTRAMSYPTHAGFTRDDALRLMEKKLFGLVLARDGVDDRHSFHKSILHVWAPNSRVADLIADAHAVVVASDDSLVDDVLVLVSVAPCCPALFYEDAHNSLALHHAQARLLCGTAGS